MSTPTKEPYLVVFMGIFGYKILSEHDTKKEAKAELARVKRAAVEEKPLRVRGFTRSADPHDFDVRTQSDLDALGRAIRDSYEKGWRE